MIESAVDRITHLRRLIDEGFAFIEAERKNFDKAHVEVVQLEVALEKKRMIEKECLERIDARRKDVYGWLAELGKVL
jgi:hypothetical protein